MLELVFLGVFAFFMALINDSLGGGYGTLSSPLLLVFGYPAKVVVPSILVSESISELFSSTWHAKFKNVNYRTFGLTTLGGIAGIAVAVYMIEVFLSSDDAKLYIGNVAVVMGILVVVRSYSWFTKHSHEKPKTNTLLSILLGVICGFNKSSTGGGYGPISTSGFQLLGLQPAKAVGTTILTKGTACLISMILWSGIVGINWTVTTPMVIGAFTGAPVAAWLNNFLKLRLTAPLHSRLVGVVMALLGIYTVLKVLNIV